MAEGVDSCVQAARGPIAKGPVPGKGKRLTARERPEMEIARVGKSAPDFEAPAYVAGEGFKNVKLSEYQGKWVVLCFYPGDFTFV